MIEPQTRRYCLVCSYYAHDYHQNDVLALEGLPTLLSVQNTPLTDQLCRDHLYLFEMRQRYLGTCDVRGVPDTYANGVPIEIYVTCESRPKHPTLGVFSQDEILNLLQYIEKRLRVLQLEVRTNWRIWPHPGDTGETIAELTAAEVVERAAWRRWIKDALPEFLKSERNRKPDDTLDDEPDDMSGEEIRDFYQQHPIDFDNRFPGGEE